MKYAYCKKKTIVRILLTFVISVFIAVGCINVNVSAKPVTKKQVTKEVKKLKKELKKLRKQKKKYDKINKKATKGKLLYLDK